MTGPFICAENHLRTDARLGRYYDICTHPGCERPTAKFIPDDVTPDDIVALLLGLADGAPGLYQNSLDFRHTIDKLARMLPVVVDAARVDES